MIVKKHGYDSSFMDDYGLYSYRKTHVNPRVMSILFVILEAACLVPGLYLWNAELSRINDKLASEIFGNSAPGEVRSFAFDALLGGYCVWQDFVHP